MTTTDEPEPTYAWAVKRHPDGMLHAATSVTQLAAVLRAEDMAFHVPSIGRVKFTVVRVRLVEEPEESDAAG
jgi:hypothetical protein